MKILLNVYPVQSGGGQQVASNFIKIIANNSYGHNWYVFVGEGSELDRLATSIISDNRILRIPYSYSKRLTAGNAIKNFINKNAIDIVYNYAPKLPSQHLPQVVRSVYSNLYFPEIPFWTGYGLFETIKKKIIDYFRLRGTLKANGLIFENEAMQERAISLFGYPLQDTAYVAPSVTDFDTTFRSAEYDKLNEIKAFKILYLSSWHLNKNIHLLPKVAHELKVQRIPVTFVLSLDRFNEKVKDYLIYPIEELNVSEYFSFIGKVEAKHVHQVVSASDAMILLSKLECFSSNVMEAFHFKKPLIISNEEWALKACNNAALYVNRDNVEDITNHIIRLVKDPTFQEELIERGTLRLKEFNTPEQKVEKQVAFLEKIYEKNKRLP